jgi:hypothetical protein
MSRPVFPFHADDISALARSLRHQLSAYDRPPSHVELMNMLARAAGSRNFQHFRAQIIAEKQLMKPREIQAPVDFVELRRLLRYFDAGARLTRWPTKFSHQEPCLWVIWSKLPPAKTLSERQINDLLLDCHRFEDPALLRREMKERRMVTRTLDGREYRRLERRPPQTALELIRILKTQASSG